MSPTQAIDIDDNLPKFVPSDIISINYDLNTTGVQDWKESPLEWTWVQTSLAPILGLIIFVTITGNGFVLLNFISRLKQDMRFPTPTHFFIANLALADFLVGVLVLPSLATLQLTSRWYFSQSFCTIWICTHFWLCATSILSTCAVCIERFVGVKYPIQHMSILSTHRIIMSVILVWILAGIPSVVRVFAWTDGEYVPISKGTNASPHYECKVNQNIGHAILSAVGVFYIPASIMVILYWKIYRIASTHINSAKNGLKGNGGLRYRVSSGSAKASSSGSSTDISSKTTSGSIKEVKINNTSHPKSPATALDKQVSLAKRLGVLVGIVLISYGPYFTFILMRAIDPHSVNTHVFDFFAWIRYFNSCVNPFIYAYAVPTYRKAFQRRLTKMSRGTLTF